MESDCEELEPLANECCGPHPCEVNFDQDFMNQVRALYPDFQGKLCEGGIFDSIIASLARPFYDMYVCDCGICDLEREASPLTACCTIDRWICEYGLENDPCFKGVCFLDEDQQVLALRAQLQARHLINAGAVFNKTLFDAIAEPLGIEYDTIVPGTFSDSSTCQQIGVSSGALKPEKNDCTPIMLGRSHSCQLIPQRFGIRITRAPKSIHATSCSVAAHPIIYNPWADAFKCIIDQIKPCHLNLCWEMDFKDNQPTFPPSFVNPCPNAKGHYVDPTVSGSGTPDDPYSIDFTKISPEQALAIACKICLNE